MPNKSFIKLVKEYKILELKSTTTSLQANTSFTQRKIQTQENYLPVVIKIGVTDLGALLASSHMKISSGPGDRGGDEKPCDWPALHSWLVEE